MVVPANFNSSQQTVISGAAAGVDRVIEVAKEAGAKRAIKLPVSAPFHSPLMKPAEEKMADELETVLIHELKAPYIPNVDGKIHRDHSQVKSFLVKQVTAPVLWDSTMETIVAQDCQVTIELGPGNVLTNLMRRKNREMKTYSIHDPDSMANCLSEELS